MPHDPTWWTAVASVLVPVTPLLTALFIYATVRFGFRHKQLDALLHDHARFDDRTATAAWFSELALFRDALSSPDAVDFYFDLSDEAAFLRARGKDGAASLVEAIDALRAPKARAAEYPAGPPPAEDKAVLQELLADSNLFKLLRTRARSTEPCP